MLTLNLPPDELTPLIVAVVEATVARLAEDQVAIGERLAFSEVEAARLLGIEEHVLRDTRRRGEIAASRIVGRRIRYERQDLLAYLAKNRIEARG